MGLGRRVGMGSQPARAANFVFFSLALGSARFPPGVVSVGAYVTSLLWVVMTTPEVVMPLVFVFNTIGEMTTSDICFPIMSIHEKSPFLTYTQPKKGCHRLSGCH